jgi:hypothetical protein
MHRRLVVGGLAALTLVIALGVDQARADVRIGINLIAPPALYVVPGTPVAYAPAVSGNYFFYAGRYYVFAEAGWFVAPRYNGPWVAVAPVYVPPALLTVPVHYYRSAPWHWRHWHRSHPPNWSAHWHGHRHGHWHGRDWRDDRHDHGRGDHRRDDHRRDRDDDRGRGRGDHRRDRS